MYRWRVYYRYRKNYDNGGPWVYVEVHPTTPTDHEGALREALKDNLTSDAEIIRVKLLYYAGNVVIGETRVVNAREARGE